MSEKPTRGRIIVGVDPSAHAARAVAWAAHEAVARGLRLHLMHALDLPPGGPGLLLPDSFVEAGRTASAFLLDRLGEDAHRLEPAVRVTTETSEFGAAESLIASGGEGDLIVTGTRGHGGFAGLLLGSVSLRTAAHSRCPAVVVHADRTTVPRTEIVLGVERDEDEAPIRFAFESCDTLGTDLTVVRARLSASSYTGRYLTDQPAAEGDLAEEVERLIAPFRARHPGVSVTVRAMGGNAVPSLLDAGRGARMIVIGAHRRRAPLSVGVGYVVQGLLSHAETAVAVVPIA